ncbi:uncharacterized protein LOC110187483 [Drosophila serrata]|uniref:uncharacterized protein LOC110187483 n=1 Tax=Drosophila serrata TaxID=7274 RepID=UPI000A1CFAC4|nr:uncharacterized protein LOC110187483 [Drosophila serrata]
MSDDKIVLLEDECYNIIEVDPVTGNNEDKDNVTVLTIQEDRPYRFLQNCNSVALWLCVLYNLCMISLYFSYLFTGN